MNVFYDTNNINLYYWGWCTKQHLDKSNILCIHNNTKVLYNFIFKNDSEALEFFELLNTGGKKEKIVFFLEKISCNPQDIFEFLLEQEIIE